jgi:hypothetical protein
MFIQQGDKPNPTLVRDRASRALFGEDLDTEAVDTSSQYTNFAYDHSNTEFNQLVSEKYQTSFEAVSLPTENVQFNRYLTDDTTHIANVDNSLQQYYNDSNPIPQATAYQVFKPKIISDFDEVLVGQTSELEETLLQKIDEVQISEPQSDTLEKVDFIADLHREEATESYLKLNAKGIIAIATFIAVTLLIITLVIVNSVAIGGASSRLSDLRAENTRLQQDVNYHEGRRAQTYADRQADVDAFVGCDQSSVEFSIENGNVIVLPPVVTYPLGDANPDASTNIFNQIASWLGSIFG